MNSTVKTIVFWLVIVLAGVLLWQVVKGANSGAKEREINYSEFMSQVDQNNVSEVTVLGSDVRGKFKNDKTAFHVVVPPNYSEMYKPMRDHGVNITVKDANGGSYTWLINLLPFVLLGALWFIMIRQMQTGGNKALSFGKSRARLLSMQQKKVTFKDVAGVDEDDAGRVFLALLEQVADAARTHADKHLDEVRTGDAEERHVGLTGNRTG